MSQINTLHRIGLALTLSILLTACGDHHVAVGTSSEVPTATSFSSIECFNSTDNLMRHAQNVAVFKSDSCYEIVVRNPWDSTALLGTYLIDEPFVRMVCYSATQWSVLEHLDELHRVKGVLEGRYVTDSVMRQLLDTGKVMDVGIESHTDMERLMTLQPDIVLYTPYQGGGDGINAALLPNTLLFPFADYLETTPLGRAEWIRVLGVMTGRQDDADVWFEEVEQRYLNLKSRTAECQSHPTVFTDLPFNGQWYVAGGQSYIARLFADAGADYIWADNSSSASVPMDFETILAKAQHADFWRVANSIGRPMTYESLLQDIPSCALFDAFKQHRLILCDVKTTGYFERSSMQPDILLADFIWFFHSELLTDEWEGYEPKFYQLLK